MCIYNEFESVHAPINCSVAQGFFSRTPSIYLHISDFNHAIKFCKVHYLADDTNLLYFSNSETN